MRFRGILRDVSRRLVVHYLDKADGILFKGDVVLWRGGERGREGEEGLGERNFFFFIGKGLWLRNEELAVEIISNWSF